MLNGILVIDKDAGMTSADVVYQLRKILHIKKMGHAGTLDPDVTGVLPIAIGQATKLIELMHQKPKEYEGSGLFGYATDSYDTDGQVTKKAKLANPFTKDEIQQGMKTFEGKIEQVPPIYSAVKVNGKHLYEYAREGIPVKRPSRTVQVYHYNLKGKPIFDREKGEESFSFEICCSKGTYVRSLVNDLGEKLGKPAVMTHLRRVASSGFSINQAVKLDKIKKQPAIAEKVIQPIDAFFADLMPIDLTVAQWQKVKNGAGISLPINKDKVALRYQGKIKAIYHRTNKGYRPDLMLLANE